jgi:hypothetical protein
MTDLLTNKTYLDKLADEKELFIENLKISKRYNKLICDHLNECKSFKQFNQDGFIWKKTPQGYDFWEKISNR